MLDPWYTSAVAVSNSPPPWKHRAVAFALHPTTVRSLCVSPLDIPLRAPFGISRGGQSTAANVLVRVELSDGTLGHGEAAPFPAYNGETQAGALGLLLRAANRLPGRDAADWRGIAAGLRARGARAGGAGGGVRVSGAGGGRGGGGGAPPGLAPSGAAAPRRLEPPREH